jgi:tRNA threonylcarbamoyl adenosine modification protein (Sua5/YciO/YrdC/YwlC family)
VSNLFEVDPSRADDAESAIAKATAELLAGHQIVLPTETVYGIACRPDDPTVTSRLFQAKRRPTGLNLPILAPSAEAGWSIGAKTEAAEKLAAEFWPGPLTLVLRRTPHSQTWSLGDEPDTVAVRVPSYPLALSLLERTGPIAATSANISGQPPLSTAEDLVAAFGDAVAVYLVLPSGVAPSGGQASTVVDLTGARAKVLREGPIESGVIEALFE